MARRGQEPVDLRVEADGDRSRPAWASRCPRPGSTMTPVADEVAAAAAGQQRGQAHPGQPHRRGGGRAPGQERPPVVSVRGVSHRSPSPLVGRAAPWAPLARHGRRHGAERPGTAVRGGARVVPSGRTGPDAAGSSTRRCRGRSERVVSMRRCGPRCDAGRRRPAVPPCPHPADGDDHRRWEPGSAAPGRPGHSGRPLRSGRGDHPGPARRVGPGRRVLGVAHGGGAVGGGARRRGGRARRRPRVRDAGQARGRGGGACPPGPAGVGRRVVRVHRPSRVRRRRPPVAAVLPPRALAHTGRVVGARASGSAPPWWWWPTSRPSSGWRSWPCWRDARPATTPWPGGPRGSLCLAPAAFTQVMGYAEGTLLALSVGTMLALRARAWWWAAALGLAAAATRPLGVLLVVPAVDRGAAGLRAALRPIALWRAPPPWPVPPWASAPSSAGWGGATATRSAPLRVQQQGTLRGGLSRSAAHVGARRVAPRARPAPRVGPAPAVGAAGRRPAGGGPAALARWPTGPSPAAVLVVALTASNLDGFERYALSAFPLGAGRRQRDVGARASSGSCSPWRRPASPSTPCSPSPTSTSRDLVDGVVASRSPWLGSGWSRSR